MKENGVADDPALLELARRASTEELAHYVETRQERGGASRRPASYRAQARGAGPRSAPGPRSGLNWRAGRDAAKGTTRGEAI
jgi:hypothetical protein